MRQLLILGFYCNIYTKEPLCRVYVNDVLLDEFNIPQCDKINVNLDRLDPFVRKNKFIQDCITNPPFLKYIEFDDADADSLDVMLKIQNDDNNHANGFMSKYTHIILSQVYLASKKSLENIDSIENNFKFSRQNWNKYNNIVNFYADSKRNGLFANLVSDIELNFSGIDLNPNESVGDYKIGSSGYFHIELQKKLGFWRDSTNRRKGYWRLNSMLLMKYLYNKYKRYENQRNTNT